MFQKQKGPWRTGVSETVGATKNRCFRNNQHDGEPVFQKQSVRWRTDVSEKVGAMEYRFFSETVSAMKNPCFRKSQCDGVPVFRDSRCDTETFFQKQSVRLRTGVSETVGATENRSKKSVR